MQTMKSKSRINFGPGDSTPPLSNRHQRCFFEVHHTSIVLQYMFSNKLVLFGTKQSYVVERSLVNSTLS